MCDGVWCRSAPASDSLDQVQLKALIHKGQHAEIASAIHLESTQNDDEIINNQQHSMQCGMSLDPVRHAHASLEISNGRRWCRRFALKFRREIFNPNCSSIIRMS